ncbi:hypothetical protein BUQ74_06535 [Leptospira weilii serovar Heyan]|nr:hypothetical protein BUQ74_06535 [Leptospira weilii serovar Heyan]
MQVRFLREESVELPQFGFCSMIRNPLCETVLSSYNSQIFSQEVGTHTNSFFMKLSLSFNLKNDRSTSGLRPLL